MLNIVTADTAPDESLADYSEALLITVPKDSTEIAIRHKLKPVGGVLNGYLTALLIQILKTTGTQNYCHTESDYDHNQDNNDYIADG